MRLIQRAFGDRTILQELMWVTIFFLLKEKGYYWGVGLVYLACKLFAAGGNCGINRIVELHDALNSFRYG